jgi:hypothetical protein
MILGFVYAHVLPYLCRLPNGVAWALELLPDEGHLIGGLIFFHVFYSIPAMVLVLSIWQSKKWFIPFWFCFIAISLSTSFILTDYDLSADAQSAIGLIIFPFVTSAFGLVSLGAGYFIQSKLNRN